MKHFGAFQAKTHFSEILSEVIKGKRFVVTKHGKNVAMIIPFAPIEDERDPIDEAISTIKKLRKGIVLGSKLSIKKMKALGRR